MPDTEESNPVRDALFGPHGLRAGWRLAIWGVLVTVLLEGASAALRPVVHGEVPRFFVRASLDFIVVFGVTALMGRLEGRRVGDYGLTRGTLLRARFWQGAAIGLVSISALLLALAACGTFRITGLALHGGAIARWALVYVLVFLLVALREEFRTRGYALFTVTTGLGFWPAAVLSSAYFTWMHSGNRGENTLGLVNVAIYALVACVMLRRTGDLAMAIGFHAAWDWGETFLYGVANSGHDAPGQLVHTVSRGPAWLSGGTVGPEGSLLCTAVLVILGVACVAWLPVTQWPTAEAIAGRGDAPLNPRSPEPAGTPSPTSPA